MKMLVRLTAALAIALVALVVPGVAAAAEPANDDFADREVLGGALPIELTRSNVDATKEPGEALDLMAPAGHSVWFEWEATASGWVTIGACEGEGEFMRLLGVYTGTAVDSLTRVASGNPSEGPSCPFSQRQYTFTAVSGTKYEIAVEGNIFNPNPGFTPDTEGEFELRVEWTPLPPNDDFADPKIVTGGISEEPDGHRMFYAQVISYNWMATKQADEPDHQGDPGGASVWFSWVAPETGTVGVSACCSGPEVVSLYRGATLTGLTPIVKGGAPFYGYPVQAGVSYRIAVDGAYDAGAGGPELGSFGLQLFMELAPGPGYGEVEEKPKVDPPVLTPPVADTTAPQTTILKRSLMAGQGKASFRFGSSESGSSFRCRLDRRPFRNCKSPATIKSLGVGSHTFRVVAIDAAGNADPTAAVARFRFPK